MQETHMNSTNKKPGHSNKINEILEAISRDRVRTNLLHKYEQRAIAWLVQRVF
jgi:hypothetical protein